MSFTFLHVADVHLGFRAYDKTEAVSKFNLRENDVYTAWQEFIRYARNNPVDAVLIAGDLFDSNTPQPAAYAMANALRTLACPCIIIMGNHERPTINSISPIEVLHGDNVFCYTEPGIHQIGDISIYCAPDIGSPYDFEPADILLTHGQLDGPPEYRYTTERLVFIADQYLYCALGDLHYHWQRKNIQYPGNLTSLTFGTEGKQFGFIHGKISSTDAVETTLVPVFARDFITLDMRDKKAWERPFDEFSNAIVRIQTVDSSHEEIEKIRQAVAEHAVHVKVVRYPVEQERKVVTIQGSTLREEYIDFCNKKDREHLVIRGLKVLGGNLTEI